VLDGCNVFIANGPIIQQLQAPLSIYIYQTIWRHLIILAHNLLIYVVIALLYGIWPSWQTLHVVPGIILVGVNGVSIGMLLGTLCARFRDIPPIVQTITQMMFLLTPILWRPNQIPGRELFYLLNPFYYLVEIIRALGGHGAVAFRLDGGVGHDGGGVRRVALVLLPLPQPHRRLAMRAPMVSVHLKNVTVSFPIYDTRSRSLKRRAMSVVTGGRVRSDPTGRISTDASHRVSIRALDRIDLAIEHGTRIGLVGRNGAGKSTLLRVLAGIYVPESGRVEVVGKAASLFGGSLSIDPELSGRENIELRGLYLGLSKEEIGKRMDDVIAFTELGPFIDMPFRAYSAGMRARLDFAISTAIQAEILLLDEGLGAGDASFIEKANERLSKLAEAAGIVVVATHSEELLRKTCTTAALMEAGRMPPAALRRCSSSIIRFWRPEKRPRISPSGTWERGEAPCGDPKRACARYPGSTPAARFAPLVVGATPPEDRASRRRPLRAQSSICPCHA